MRGLTTLIAAWLLAIPAAAHEGEDHSKDAAKLAQTARTAPGSATEAPQRLADGSLFVPKAAQRQLGIRTTVGKVGDLAQTVELIGRVVTDPNAGGQVQSSQAGRVEAGPRGLPTLGQKVTKGEVLAYVRPVAGSIERGNQQAALAELRANRGLAEKKLARLEALEGTVPQKEIEAAKADLQSLTERSAAVGGSLANREPLVAPVSGVVSAAAAVNGQVVEAREVLFEIIDPQRLMVEALAYDPAIVASLAGASGVPHTGPALQLALVGGARQMREQALPVLFRVLPPLPPLAVGQPVKVVAQMRQTVKGIAVPVAAIVKDGAGDSAVWVHDATEHFVARKIRPQPLDGLNAAVTAGLAAGDRIVTEGAAVLSQVR
jgi:biotin carboxyl carrier protein